MQRCSSMGPGCHLPLQGCCFDVGGAAVTARERRARRGTVAVRDAAVNVALEQGS